MGGNYFTFNLIPLTGMSMPFVSYGGTGYIVNIVLAGIILAVWRRNNWLTKTQKKQANDGGRLIKFESGSSLLTFNNSRKYYGK